MKIAIGLDGKGITKRGRGCRHTRKEMTISKLKVVVSVLVLLNNQRAINQSHSLVTNKTKVIITLSCIEVTVVTMSSKLANPGKRRKDSKSVQLRLTPDN